MTTKQRYIKHVGQSRLDQIYMKAKGRGFQSQQRKVHIIHSKEALAQTIPR